MDENLLGYILDTLDLGERLRVEAQLEADPSLREQLDRARQVLAPLAEDAEAPEPPASLALATLARVAEHQCRLPHAPTGPRRAAGSAHPRWFRRVDVLVAACLLLLVGGLLAPLIVQQWRGNARVACANNLRLFWQGLSMHADQNAGAFPVVKPDGVAGIFVPVLDEAGLIDGVTTDCVAPSHVAPPRVTVAEMERLARENEAFYHATARKLSGSYAYCLGYDDGGMLCGLTRKSGDGLPILADRPGPGGRNSPNHGGGGQNVLFVGGHVRWAATPTAGVGGDHIYLNHNDRRAAGVCRTDSVLAPGDVGPYSGE